MAIWLLEASPLNFVDNTVWAAMLAVITFVVHWAIVAADNRVAAWLSIVSAIMMYVALFDIYFVGLLSAALVAAAWLTMMIFAWIKSQRLWADSTTDFYLCLFAATGMVASQLSYAYTNNFDVANWSNAVLQWLLLASLVSLAIRGLSHLIKRNRQPDNDELAPVYTITTLR